MIIASHYAAGIFNQLTSFEISYGLSKFLDDKVLVHGVGQSLQGRRELDESLLPRFVKINNNLSLIDVINFESHENLILEDEVISNFFTTENSYDTSYIMHYFNLNKSITEGKEDFANGRKEILPGRDYIMKGANLVYYSSFFFNADKNFDMVMSSIKFKKEYYEFAKLIADIVGKFNGCHIRRRDHVNVVDIGESMFKSGVDRFDNDYPILVSTDEAHNPMFKNNKIILIEDFISDNLIKEFKQLDDQSDLGLAIISNLVMRHSEDFIGTGTSTFTGHIQRDLYKNKNIEFKFFNENLMPKIENRGSRYSWGNVNLPIEYKAVLREWPECRPVD